MSHLAPEDKCEIVSVEDDSAFRSFLEGDPTGLAMIPQAYGSVEVPVLSCDAGDFRKWLKSQQPEMHIQMPEADLLALRSGEIWLPLVFLASDVALPVYLNLVACYMYDRMRGALRGDRLCAHMTAEFLDGESGSVKRFCFKGDADALKAVIKKFDVNRFLDD